MNLIFSRLTIFGHDARREITFRPGLNVVVGPYGSGKSSLLELLKFALGGNAVLSEAVSSGVTTVVLDVEIEGAPLTFERDIGAPTVRVSSIGEPTAVLHSTNPKVVGTVLASRFLLEASGLPVVRVQRARGRSSSAKETISFWDLYHHAYVSQDEMGQSIAGSADSNMDRKRRRAFELMVGLVDEQSAMLETALADVTARLATERKRLADVSDFLTAAMVPNRGEILSQLEALNRERESARAQLQALRRSSRSSTAEVQPDRTALQALYRRQVDLLAAAEQLRGEVDARRRLEAQLSLDRERLSQATSASDLLGPLDFKVCPRCQQDVSPERSEHDRCYLCTQALEPTTADPVSPDEEDRLISLESEVRDLRVNDELALSIVTREIESIATEIQAVERDLADRTDTYVAPLFEQIASLSARVAEADADETRLTSLSLQWDQRAAIRTSVTELEAELRTTADDLADELQRLEAHRAFVHDFSRTFDEILEDLQFQWYESSSVSINQRTFLPEVGSGPYKSLSGGQRTVVSVAYHLALLTLGLLHPHELQIPNLLILDTPSKYLGGKDGAQIRRDFERIAAIVGAYKSPVQIIVADNAAPPPGIQVAHTIELSYDDPLVPGVAHPGPEHVTPIYIVSDEEQVGEETPDALDAGDQQVEAETDANGPGHADGNSPTDAEDA